MWSAVVEGQELTFYLVGINNQNFIMADHQTGSWWQQVTGQAIRGPLAGKQLELLPWDEVAFSIWRSEHPDTTVLASTPEFEEHYDWDEMGNREGYEFTVDAQPEAPLERGELIVGLQLPEGDKAYPMSLLVETGPINDHVGDRPVLLVVADDQRSVRAFDRSLEGQVLELYRKADPSPDGDLVLIDSATGSEWSFAGEAIAGTLEGKRLERLQTLKDYWFDWDIYHPDAALYRVELPAPTQP